MTESCEMSSEETSTTLKWGDYLVIVAYFVFVLFVGLWVRKIENYCCKYKESLNIRHPGGPREAVLVDTSLHLGV